MSGLTCEGNGGGGGCRCGLTREGNRGGERGGGHPPCRASRPSPSWSPLVATSGRGRRKREASGFHRRGRARNHVGGHQQGLVGSLRPDRRPPWHLGFPQARHSHGHGEREEGRGHEGGEGSGGGAGALPRASRTSWPRLLPPHWEVRRDREEEEEEEEEEGGCGVPLRCWSASLPSPLLASGGGRRERRERGEEESRGRRGRGKRGRYFFYGKQYFGVTWLA